MRELGHDVNVVRYDAYGQGETLRKYGLEGRPIAVQDQVADLDSLLDELAMPEKVVLAGLSYGGALALEYTASHPERAAKAILMAPYTEPLASQGVLIRAQVRTIRLQGLLNPLNILSDDDLVGLTKVLAREGATYGITANVICPGYVKMSLVERQVEAQAAAHGIDPEQVAAEVFLKKQPLKSFIALDTIAELAWLMASDKGATMTGSVKTVDGGWTAQ